MYILEYLPIYRKKLHKYTRYYKNISKILQLLSLNPYNRRLNTKKSNNPEFKNAYASSIDKKCYIYWRYGRGKTIYLLGIMVL